MVFVISLKSFNERSDKYGTYINNKTGLIDTRFNDNKGIDIDSDFSYIGISYSFQIITSRTSSYEYYCTISDLVY